MAYGNTKVKEVHELKDVRPGSILIIHFKGQQPHDDGYGGTYQVYETSTLVAEDMEAAESHLKDFYQRKLNGGYSEKQQDMLITTLGEIKTAKVEIKVA